MVEMAVTVAMVRRVPMECRLSRSLPMVAALLSSMLMVVVPLSATVETERTEQRETLVPLALLDRLVLKGRRELQALLSR